MLPFQYDSDAEYGADRYGSRYAAGGDREYIQERYSIGVADLLYGGSGETDGYVDRLLEGATSLYERLPEYKQRLSSENGILSGYSRLLDVSVPYPDKYRPRYAASTSASP